MKLELTPVPGFPLIKPGDDLAEIIINTCEKAQIGIQGGDIFVLAQKIVSKSEGRLVNLNDVAVTEDAINLAEKTGKDPRIVALVLSESRKVLRYRTNVLIVEHKLGFVCANAGIDHSNVHGLSGNPDDWMLLLPVDPDGSADKIRTKIEARKGVRIGIMIIDSHGRAWRNGTLGTVIGLSGVPGLVDLRGQPDLFGFRLKITQVAAGDELAAGASLMMGQAAEGTPVVHARGFPYALRESSLNELIRPEHEDLFR
ncbi:MAG TPA: coenzyme F420-0:L-glutamate ligase [Anaerolineaceae bacterium]|nr:coenzyme F420-0:L-glutamate ligase [Anaerolineaceae bacterium]